MLYKGQEEEVGSQVLSDSSQPTKISQKDGFPKEAGVCWGTHISDQPCHSARTRIPTEILFRVRNDCLQPG